MLAFTFPGQGSQRSGMGAAWADHPSWEIVQEASEVAGRDLAGLLVEASMETLTLTANAQLATMVQSLVVLDAVERLGSLPRRARGTASASTPRWSQAARSRSRTGSAW